MSGTCRTCVGLVKEMAPCPANKIKSQILHVSRPRHPLLGGDVPQTQISCLSSLDKDHNAPACSRRYQRSQKDNFVEVSVQSITSPTKRPCLTKKPTVHFHSRRHPKETDIGHYTPLMENRPGVHQEVVIVECRSTFVSNINDSGYLNHK